MIKDIKKNNNEPLKSQVYISIKAIFHLSLRTFFNHCCHQWNPFIRQKSSFPRSCCSHSISSAEALRESRHLTTRMSFRVSVSPMPGGISSSLKSDPRWSCSRHGKWALPTFQYARRQQYILRTLRFMNWPSIGFHSSPEQPYSNLSHSRWGNLPTNVPMSFHSIGHFFNVSFLSDCGNLMLEREFVTTQN